ncbi:MAG: hypothetical protein ACJ8BW_34310 [Ktedonobacteraceae bacterium]
MPQRRGRKRQGECAGQGKRKRQGERRPGHPQGDAPTILGLACQARL